MTAEELLKRIEGHSKLTQLRNAISELHRCANGFREPDRQRPDGRRHSLIPASTLRGEQFRQERLLTVRRVLLPLLEELLSDEEAGVESRTPKEEPMRVNDSQ
ncbi:MAG TPA: hypothetical protein VF791_04190 [Pyrinomonadaceae bacterium]